MKKRLIFVFVILMIGFYMYGEVKIGVLDPLKVVRNTTRGKEVMTRLENLGKLKQKKIIDMRAEIKNLEKELLSPALSQKTRQSKTLLLQEKQTKLKRLIEDSRREFETKRQQELGKLHNEIMPVIREIGKSKGYTIIFDVTISGISYYDQGIDITDMVIKEFNSRSKTKK